MSAQAQALEHASVRQYCKAVKVPVIGANFVPLAEQAVKENRGQIGYLEALLAMESEERDRHVIAHRLHSNPRTEYSQSDLDSARKSCSSSELSQTPRLTGRCQTPAL